MAIASDPSLTDDGNGASLPGELSLTDEAGTGPLASEPPLTDESGSGQPRPLCVEAFSELSPTMGAYPPMVMPK